LQTPLAMHSPLTRNEILYALNQAEKFRLAIVTNGPHDATESPFYPATPFTKNLTEASLPSTTTVESCLPVARRQRTEPRLR